MPFIDRDHFMNLGVTLTEDDVDLLERVKDLHNQLMKPFLIAQLGGGRAWSSSISHKGRQAGARQLLQAYKEIDRIVKEYVDG